MTHDPAKTAPARPPRFWIIAAYATGLALFTNLAGAISRHTQLAFDVAIQDRVRSYSSPAMTAIAKPVTAATSTETMIVVGAGVLGWLYYKRLLREAIFFAVSLGGAIAINQVLKHVFERPRLSLWTPLVAETGFAFPSGHTMAAAALAISLVILLWRTKWRWTALAVGLIYTYAVGCSRVYLGVHYPADIVATWIVSALWALTAYLVIRPHAAKETPHHEA